MPVTARDSCDHPTFCVFCSCTRPRPGMSCLLIVILNSEKAAFQQAVSAPATCKGRIWPRVWRICAKFRRFEGCVRATFNLGSKFKILPQLTPIINARCSHFLPKLLRFPIPAKKETSEKQPVENRAEARLSKTSVISKTYQKSYPL